MGVVLNRPSEVTVGEAVPQLEGARRRRRAGLCRRPVQPSSIVFLAEFLDPSPAGLLVLGRIGFPAPDAEIDELDRGDRARAGVRRLCRLGRGTARRGDRAGRLDRPRQRCPTTSSPTTAGGALERCARAQGRQLRADGAHAAGSEHQLRRTLAIHGRAVGTSPMARRPDIAAVDGDHRSQAPADVKFPLAPPTLPEDTDMLKLARWSTTHRQYVLIGWVVLLIGVNALAQSAGTSYSNNFTLPNSDAQRAADLLQAQLPRAGRRPRHDRLQGRAPARARPSRALAHERDVRGSREAAARRRRDQPLRRRRRRQGDLGRREDRVRHGRVRRKSQPAAQERRRTRRQRRPRGRAPRAPGRARRPGDRADRSRPASASPPRSA